MSNDYIQTPAIIYEIKGLIDDKTCQIANKVLNYDKYSKIIETQYDDYNYTRKYIVVKTEEPYIKYVGLNRSIPNNIIDQRFRVGYDYSIVNIKSVHQITLPELKSDNLSKSYISEFIADTDVYKFIKLSGIDYSIIKINNNNYTLSLNYFDVNYEVLKSKLANLLPI